MVADSSLRDHLDEVLELLRTVRPAEAQERLVLTLRSLSPSDLHIALPLLEATINRFHKKRRRELFLELDAHLERLRFQERTESSLECLAELARQAEEAIKHTTQASVALTSLVTFEEAKASALVEIPDLKARLEAVVRSLQEAVETRLKALFEAQVTSLLGQIRNLEAGDIGSAPTLIGEARQAASNLTRTFPSLQVFAANSVSTIERATALKIAGSPLPVHLAWRHDLLELVRAHVEAALEQPDWHDSQSLAAAVLSYKSVQATIQEQSLSPSLVQWVIALSRFARERPALEGSTRFADLTTEDIVLASRYSGMKDVLRLVDEDGVRSLPGLEQRLDEQAYKTFLVCGLQPRIAELAFARVAASVVGMQPKFLLDLNLDALRSGHPLPTEDFAVNGLRFDVKCNLYFRAYKDRRGLRGFQINVAHRSPSAVAAAFVISGASQADADWAFVGFASEAGLSPTNNRAAPFCFSLPSRLNFENPWLESHLDEAISLVDAAPDDDSAKGFNASDRYALRRSLQSIQQVTQLTERMLWDEVTGELMRLRSTGSTEEQGAEFLNIWRSRAKSGYWLFPLASIGGRPLLDRWIDQVLDELNRHWNGIRCPACQKAGRISIVPQRITDGGTVLGAFHCGCGAAHGEAALVTHCWRQGCGRYPLVIGDSATCGCFGLRCECGACRCGR